jgi:hypothetical protein
MAKPFAESILFQVAHNYEKNNDWYKKWAEF